MEFEKPLGAQLTNIPGMLVFDLSVHGDARGWFKENWQRAKMVELGLPDFGPVQNNISFNASRGVTRGIHAEPWNKLISVAAGSVFGAWVDLRPGESCGEVFTCVLDASKAVYVPRGVGNSYQALEDGTAYTYLVDAHWSAQRKGEYTFVNPADPSLDIDWPIPLEEAALSEADRAHPMLANAKPMEPLRILVTGGKGQLGSALENLTRIRGLAGWEFVDLPDLDITSREQLAKIDWPRYSTIVNCAGYTAVDAAELDRNRSTAWAVNARGAANLAKIAVEQNLTLVHLSSDYVFDGTFDWHSEEEELSPLGVYAQTKAAADAAVGVVPRHYIVRTSWAVGNGKNFVRTMCGLSDRCALPEDEPGYLAQVSVVDDQVGRLTFMSTLARAIVHLIETGAPFGTYNVSNGGEPASWYEIARRVFALRNGNEDAVRPVSAQDYAADSAGPVAPRPPSSLLDLSRLEATGFKPARWEDELEAYLR